jgi:hypothetical protein
MSDPKAPDNGESATNSGKRKSMEKSDESGSNNRAAKKTSKVCMLSTLPVSFRRRQNAWKKSD